MEDLHVHKFIRTINPTIDVNDRNIFWTLVNSIDSAGDAELEYVQKHPEVLTIKLEHQYVFDYFYEKVIHDRCHPTKSAKWQDTLLKVITLLNRAPNRDLIKNNKKYLLRLQSSSRTLDKIFAELISEDFEMGDPEFLVYSIIARGELAKLEILSAHYIVEDYSGVLDVALRYGRYVILSWFKKSLHIDTRYYGKVMDFENYKDNQRYIYYKEHIANDESFRHKAIVGANRQNYITSINIILEGYDYPITYQTIERWCDLIKSKVFVWDRINPANVLPLLLTKLDKPLPLTSDFGEFNALIFGHEWSDRKCLIEHSINLQQKLDASEARIEAINMRYSHLQLKYDSLMSHMESRKGCRIRRETN